MMTSAEGIWAEIRYRLRGAATVNYWSLGRGDHGGKTFRAVMLDAGTITVTASGIAKERRISMAEFIRVARLWPGYKDGTTSRSELAATKSQNTSYIIGLLHWRETQLEAAKDAARLGLQNR